MALDAGVEMPCQGLSTGAMAAQRLCSGMVQDLSAGYAQEAVDAIVAVNHATGLRYMRDEDHTVGTWVSPMHLKYLSGDDIGLFFWPWGLHDEYIMVS